MLFGGYFIGVTEMDESELSPLGHAKWGFFEFAHVLPKPINKKWEGKHARVSMYRS